LRSDPPAARCTDLVKIYRTSGVGHAHASRNRGVVSRRPPSPARRTGRGAASLHRDPVAGVEVSLAVKGVNPGHGGGRAQAGRQRSRVALVVEASHGQCDWLPDARASGRHIQAEERELGRRHTRHHGQRDDRQARWQPFASDTRTSWSRCEFRSTGCARGTDSRRPDESPARVLVALCCVRSIPRESR
jgi:hypothetical protein